MDMLKGAKAIVQNYKRGISFFTAMAFAAALFSACSGGASNGTANGGVDPNETAAKVNGKVIKMEEVDRGVKQQTQGQDSKLSPLELAGARLQVLQSLVEQEVMFQKAEKESQVPTEEEVTTELNKRKTASGKSADTIAKEMKDSGVTEASVRDSLKKELAIQKLIDKITGKKKGVKLAAIVIDPANNGEGDTTTDEQSAVLKANEIIKQLQQGVDFATVAREKSEDQSRFQNGELGYISEEEMKQTFPANVAGALMSPEFQIGKIVTAQMQGKYYILKLQERSDKDEAVTLEGPGIRQQVTDELVKARKQLLASSYQAIAMNEAKIENFLAKKVVDNPNELSGARPAGAASPAANTAANSNANTAVPAANSNSANANANAKPAANEPAKPASNAPAKPAANANK